MKKIRLSLLLLLIVISANAYSIITPDSLFNNISDTAQIDLEPQEFLYNTTKFIKAYGSYRVNFGINTNGYFGMSDNASRFGIEGTIPVSKKHNINMFAVIEFGTNLVDRDEIIVFRPDPGAEFTEEGNAVFSRLGFVGISSRYFDLSVGKQWSVYYDVAQFTDQFFAFGAEASATFNLGSDGGISGTGRANRVFLLRPKIKGAFKLAAQIQMRYITDNFKTFADTYGASIRYEPDFGLLLGFAFNIVRDGVDNPKFNQPKTNDQAYTAAIGYIKDRIHIAYSVSRFFNHERIEVTDSVNYYFSGSGMELFVSYYLTRNKKWRAATGFNFMLPNNVPEVGDYRLLYFLGEISYNFSKASYIFTTAKINQSTSRAGLIDKTGVFAMGLRFSFGY